MENPPEKTPGWHSSELETSQDLAWNERYDLVGRPRGEAVDAEHQRGGRCRVVAVGHVEEEKPICTTRHERAACYPGRQAALRNDQGNQRRRPDEQQYEPYCP